MLQECEVAPKFFREAEPRLERFLEPFVVRREQVEHARTFVSGLLSDLDHRNVESIACRFGYERLPLQHFIGESHWDNGVVRDELVRQIAPRPRRAGRRAGVRSLVVSEERAAPLHGSCSSHWN